MVAWKMFHHYLPEEAILKKNESELSIFLTNGSEICLKGAENEDSLRGAGLSGVVLDEYASMKSNVWGEIIRPALADKQGWGLFIGTPAGKNHFYNHYLRGLGDDKLWGSWHLMTIDSPTVPASEVAQAREEMNEEQFKQEFEADFIYFAGLIWKHFSHADHVVQPYEIDPNWETNFVIDHGFANPTGVLFYAIDHDGNVHIYAEHYEAKKVISHHADVIKRIQPDYADKIALIDPSTNAKNQTKNGHVYSIRDEYFDNGILTQNANNNVKAGLNRVDEYFKAKKIKIFNTCHHLIKEIEGYQWKEGNPDLNAPEEPLKINDHLCDDLRYLIMGRPDSAPAPDPELPVTAGDIKKAAESWGKQDNNSIEAQWLDDA